MGKIQWNITTWKRKFLQSLSYERYYWCRVCKDFEIKNLVEYHDLFVQSNTLLLPDVIDNFKNMCLEIYEPDPAKFLSASGLAWQSALNKTKVKLNLSTDIDMLLMV